MPGRLRQVPDPLAGLPFRPGVLHRVDQLAHELVRDVHARDEHAGDLAALCLVLDPEEVERELVLREADVPEVRIAAGHLRIEVDVQLALLRAVRFHDSTILPR